ncbi:hypothetical protein FP828_03695 [bacterium]|nr:hypothetical protein [Candidatus Omnitrophota bacterium]MBA3065576.1 hypothetical protein [bacterium]
MTKPITHCGEIADAIKKIFPDIVEFHQLRESILMRIKHSDGKKYTITIHPEQRISAATKKERGVNE